MSQFKKVNNSDPGDSTHFGGNDLDELMGILNGENTSSKPIIFKRWIKVGSNQLLLLDPDENHYVMFQVAEQTYDRHINIQDLGATDKTMAFLESTQTWASQTMPTDTNSIKDSNTNNAGDLLSNNGSKFVRKARGSALQVLRMNSDGSDNEWVSLNDERVGKAVASGDGNTTQFNILHGLGGTPTYAFVDCASHSIARTFAVDATDIYVYFDSAPDSGTDNVIIYWRVIA